MGSGCWGPPWLFTDAVCCMSRPPLQVQKPLLKLTDDDYSEHSLQARTHLLLLVILVLMADKNRRVVIIYAGEKIRGKRSLGDGAAHPGRCLPPARCAATPPAVLVVMVRRERGLPLSLSHSHSQSDSRSHPNLLPCVCLACRTCWRSRGLPTTSTCRSSSTSSSPSRAGRVSVSLSGLFECTG